MMNIDRKEGVDMIRFGEVELSTNTEGRINIIDLPEGDYTLKFQALFNLEKLFNLNGDIQDLGKNYHKLQFGKTLSQDELSKLHEFFNAE